MKIVFQRVNSGFVEADGIKSEIGKGAVIFLGVAENDDEKHVEKLASKVAELRVFEDEDEKMNLSVKDVDGEILVIPNFTLCGDTSKGRRPAFINAARPNIAKPLFKLFTEKLKENGVRNVEAGIFGADMRVMVENDGPVTLILEEE